MEVIDILPGLDEAPFATARGASQLRAASRQGDLQTTRSIVENWDGSYGRAFFAPAIREAVDNRHLETLHYLLSHGPPIKIWPIQRAIDAGLPETLGVLMKHGWDINEILGQDKTSALGYVHIHNPSVTDSSELSLSYSLHDRVLTRWLLDNGADPNAGNDEYLTVMSLAALWAQVSTLQMLLVSGGDVQRGQVLHWAVQRSDGTEDEIVKLLLSYGAPLNRLDYDGKPPQWYALSCKGLGTPLHEAAWAGKSNLIAILIEHGADATIKDILGRTPADIAREQGHEYATQLLEYTYLTAKTSAAVCTRDTKGSRASSV
ncbi:hypothetical protein FH972_024094 [Carpinus fangiana]|uniref:Uncharacterized protein n=1 Tax=Carpinus fangiana TaxID=176857 RepID=A0A5N6KXG1_9ROSI|nr:hypothetical protein FH972_024094 [Carpinus fangiana]